MKKIILIITAIVLLVLLFPKSYHASPGLVPIEVAKSWKAPTCIGIHKKITGRIPEGPDMWCFGIVTQ
jgi:hypothetical protein